MQAIQEESSAATINSTSVEETKPIHTDSVGPACSLAPLSDLKAPKVDLTESSQDSHINDNSILSQIKFYSKRWGPAEACGKGVSFAGLLLSYGLGANAFVIATVATWAENLGFYGVNTLQRYKEEINSAPLQNKNIFNKLKCFGKAVYETVTDFGLSELVDSLLVRPLGILGVSSFVSSYLAEGLTAQIAGWVVGTVIADTVFYSFATLSHKTKKFLS